MKRKWLFNLACILALLAAAGCTARTAQVEATEPPDQIGPYRAGFTFQIFYDETRSGPDENGRPVVSYIWYPADPGDPADPAYYSLDPLGLWGGTEGTFSTHYEKYGLDPAYAGLPVSSGGPFPLVVYSPGWGMDATYYFQTGLRLASHGFVVVIPTHYGDGALGEAVPEDEFTGIAWAAINRTDDIKFLITKMLALSADPGSLFYQTIHPDKIVASGHSWGGLGAMLLASTIDEFCALEPAYPPETCIPITPDPRVKAIVSVDGGGWLLRVQDLERITIPYLGIGQEYPTDPIDWHVREHFGIKGYPNYRVDVKLVNHGAFSNGCEAWNVAHDTGYISDEIYPQALDWFCPDLPMPDAEPQRLTYMYMIAFLKTVLGIESYQFMLTPDYAKDHEPFAVFFETEKRSAKLTEAEWPDWPTYLSQQR